MKFTGERFVPGTQGEIWVEHWHRYHFAARWARGRRVLDVACGEGYGSALLARHAAHVTGVDLSTEAIAHAGRTYAGTANLEFVSASCTQLPLPAASFDVVVSFETLEHIGEQRDFLAEVARVLKPDGVVVLSCPNKLEYSDKRQFANEFHVKELYREELAALVGGHFPHIAWYGHRPTFFSVIAPEGLTPAAAELHEVAQADTAESRASLSHPLYFILVAGQSRAAVDEMPPILSVLSDRDDWVHRDYEKVMRDLGGAAAERDTAQKLLVERDATIARMKAELSRRGGLRYWLKLPLYRLGILKHPPV
ncbi:MAG TPA: class I SAM-dependent methyltransferase [Usitatibacter sp.]|nr:class I SAM-dependent methyltransferase [Usitatibacter sp.]